MYTLSLEVRFQFKEDPIELRLEIKFQIVYFNYNFSVFDKFLNSCLRIKQYLSQN